jgi:hypothetical protein
MDDCSPTPLCVAAVGLDDFEAEVFHDPPNNFSLLCRQTDATLKAQRCLFSLQLSGVPYATVLFLN